MTTEERCADAIAREARRTAAAGAVFAVLWVLLGFGYLGRGIPALGDHVDSRRDGGGGPARVLSCAQGRGCAL